MIVLSLLLMLGALCLLVIGLLHASLALVVGSLVASVAAGIVLYLAARRRHVASDAETGADTEVPAPPLNPSEVRAPSEPYGAPRDTEKRDTEETVPAAPPPGGSAPPAGAGQQAPPAGGWHAPSAEQWPPAPPPDEPPEEQVAPGDAAWLADRSDEVTVIDGRPRYHQVSCPHLIGRPTIALPLSDAREAGFTPCSLCRPDAEVLTRR